MAQQLPSSIDEYIDGCALDVQPLLHLLRRTIANAAPEATEKISWGMATFFYYGNLVHFSAEKKHIGFHPAPTAIEAFHEELIQYHSSKGTVRFPYEEPLPLELIDKMVRFRAAEQLAFALEKQAGKKNERTLRPRDPIPEDMAQVLWSNALNEAYEARPPYQRNDYIGWITRAKQPETRQKRLAQMLDELRAGDAYMGSPYLAKK